MAEAGNETDPPIPPPPSVPPTDTKVKAASTGQTETEPKVGVWPEPSTDPAGDARREEARVQREKDRKKVDKERNKNDREGLYDGGDIPR